MKFNTAISRLMECMNHFTSHTTVQAIIKRDFIKIIAPIVPHIAEETWEINAGTNSVFNEQYPKYDEALLEENCISIAIQVNGKLRGSITVEKDIVKADLINQAKQQENVILHIGESEIVKEIKD